MQTIEKIKWCMPCMLFRRFIRFILTFIVYLIESLLLLKVVELLFGDAIDFRPFTSLLGLKVSIWIRQGPVAFLCKLSPVQLLTNAVTRGLNMTKPPVDAVGSVIGVIGIGSTFIAWLTSSAERLVCGIRTGELLNWAHHFFFVIYCFVFLPLAFLGIFSANSERWEATVYALLGVLVGLVFTLFVCFEFVLSAVWREKLALQHYYKMVCPCIAVCWTRWGGHICKSARTHSPAIKEDVRRAMLSVADYSRNQAEVYHRNFSSNMVRLWINSCWLPFQAQSKLPDCGRLERPTGTIDLENFCTSWLQDGQSYFRINEDWPVHYPTAYISDEQDYIVAHTLLDRDVWAQLLPTDKLTPQELAITRQILYSLWKMKQDRRCTGILLGLLFRLEDTQPMDQLIPKLDLITRSDASSDEENNVPKEVRSELAWALLMICVVAWIQEGTDRDHHEMLDAFCRHFSGELNECCEDLTHIKSDNGWTEEDVAETGAKLQRGDVILWYAEWAARKRRGLSLDRYLMGISTMFDQGNAYAHFKLNEFSYRKEFLLGILCQHYFNISYGNGTQ